jgi:hypothetical protein
LDFDLAQRSEVEGEGKGLFWTTEDGHRYPSQFSVFIPKDSLYVQLDPLYSKYLHSIAERSLDDLDSYALTLDEYERQNVGEGVKKLLLNPWTGDRVIPRETRTSLTFRVVKKVLKAGGLMKGLLGKR